MDAARAFFGFLAAVALRAVREVDVVALCAGPVPVAWVGGRTLQGHWQGTQECPLDTTGFSIHTCRVYPIPGVSGGLRGIPCVPTVRMPLLYSLYTLYLQVYPYAR